MKEEKLYLILGSHAHVPSGASEKDFENIYQKRMLPFVTNLYRYSNVQAVLHYSGVLLYWVERTHPEFFMLIEDMVSRKQAEILSGGFYEPVFPIIPLQDRIGQIELLTTYLRKHFGIRPLGCWIANMAWEQHLAASLSASDMNYTFLCQDQFLQAGMSGKEIYSPCITEDQGKLVTVFPVSLSIEKELAEKSFSQVFNELKKKMEEEYGSVSKDIIISVFPEKASSSQEEAPDTSWNRFFEEVSLCENIVETILPAKVFKTKKFSKKASFPNSTFFGNGFSPRRFIIDHCEANGIYSKMIYTNVLISQLKGDKYRKQNAREELWKAQDSRLFTPGNGHLHGELRKAAYSSLLRAEKMSREKGKFISSIVNYDFDFDGIKENLFQDDKINCYVQLNGASIFELDYIPKEWNYLDCGGSGGERRVAFADMLLPPQTKIADINDIDHKNTRFCFNEQFDSASQSGKGKTCFKLPASGNNLPFGGIELNKCYSLKRDLLTVSYNLKNTSKEAQSFCFVTEINLSFAGVGEENVRIYTIDPSGKDTQAQSIFDNTSSLKILDVKNEVQILLASSNVFSGSLFNICVDELYQATRIMPLFSVTLESGKTWTNDFSLKFSH